MKKIFFCIVQSVFLLQSCAIANENIEVNLFLYSLMLLFILGCIILVIIIAIKKITHKENKKKQCPHRSKQDCPYSSRKNCKHKKNNCYHPKVKYGVRFSSFFRAILFAVIGIVVYLLGIAYLGEFKTIYNIITGISLSCVAGALIAIIVDFPKTLNKYEDSILEALTSDVYLKKLETNKLKQLRESTTELLYKKDAPMLPQGIISLDSTICELLAEPYYERFEQTVNCSVCEEDENYITKDVHQEYKIINPYRGTGKSLFEDITIKSSVCIDDSKDINFYYEVISVKYAVDGKEKKTFIDCTPNIKFYKEKIANDNQYNYKIYFSLNEDKYEPLTIKYDDNVIVYFHYKFKVLKTDVLFFLRLRHSTSRFRISYAFNDPDYALQGKLIGTLISNMDHSSMQIDENKIEIESNDWLLKENGVAIVFNKKN